ncbi:MAG: hypothetical protein CM1200mP2_09590 [Planctomycetaceae bacterium]|nr:MAG: hypothetical protein CM1200mP2_09590 [Planctomycetaceae bacterium]
MLLTIGLMVGDTAPAQRPAAPPAKSVVAPQPPAKPPKVTGQPTAKPSDKPGSPQPKNTANWIFLPGLEGQRIPVPTDLWKDFLRWQNNQQAPPFHVTSVSLDGRVQGDRALLNARVEVRVQRADEWIPVSLRMGNGNTVLTSPVTYKGPGQSRPDTQKDQSCQRTPLVVEGQGASRVVVPTQRPGSA